MLEIYMLSPYTLGLMFDFRVSRLIMYRALADGSGVQGTGGRIWRNDELEFLQTCMEPDPGACHRWSKIQKSLQSFD